MDDKSISQADRVKALTEQLKAGVQDIFSSGKYAEYLGTLSRFHRYSYRNSMLIYLQNPDATRVAGFNSWKTLGRSVNKGEKGLQILAPSPYKVTVEETKDEYGNPLSEPQKKEVQRMAFKVTHVFDISQTSGKELPALAHRLTGQVGEYDRLMSVLRKVSPYPIAFEEISRASVNGYCDYEAKRIVIRESVSQEQAVKTAVHEMAHALLHSSKTGEERDRQAFEVQAESVAYVVCQHFGIDSSQYSFGYVAGWSGSIQMEVLEQSLTVIQTGALRIIDSTEMELMVRDREITLSDHTFDDDNYLHFVATVDNRAYEGFFRVHDPANGKSMQIVSIDNGEQHPAFEGQWDKLTESLREYSQERYGELITRENPDLAAQMRALAQIPYYVDGFSEDFLMWKDITTGKTHGYDGWEGVAIRLDSLDGLHQTELRQLWEIETNDPATQEWRSLLHPDEQMLVTQWDKEYALSIRTQESERPNGRSIHDKLKDAKVEADRMNTERHARRTAKQHDIAR